MPLSYDPLMGTDSHKLLKGVETDLSRLFDAAERGTELQHVLSRALDSVEDALRLIEEAQV